MNHIAALVLFRGADFLGSFDEAQRDALGMLFLDLSRQGNSLYQVFWGLWLFPFGLLVMRSGFLPRVLGVLLILNGVAYVVASLTWLLAPPYANIVFQATSPALLGELCVVLWLLIKGRKYTTVGGRGFVTCRIDSPGMLPGAAVASREMLPVSSRATIASITREAAWIPR